MHALERKIVRGRGKEGWVKNDSTELERWKRAERRYDEEVCPVRVAHIIIVIIITGKVREQTR